MVCGYGDVGSFCACLQGLLRGGMLGSAVLLVQTSVYGGLEYFARFLQEGYLFSVFQRKLV